MLAALRCSQLSALVSKRNGLQAGTTSAYRVRLAIASPSSSASALAYHNACSECRGSVFNFWGIDSPLCSIHAISRYCPEFLSPDGENHQVSSGSSLAKQFPTLLVPHHPIRELQPARTLDLPAVMKTILAVKTGLAVGRGAHQPAPQNAPATKLQKRARIRQAESLASVSRP